MLKKVLITLFVLLMLCASAFAMQFSQPVKLGSIMNTPYGGFIFSGANSNTGNPYFHKGFPNRKLYKSGIATFGNGINALYVHYDDEKEINILFGNKDVRNVFTLYDDHMIESGIGISKIETNSGLVLYVLNREGGGWWGDANCSIIGRREDGVFVKYFDMNNIRGMYFKKPKYVHLTKLYTKGDLLIVSYEYSYPNSEIKGEFRFKWDNAAQWFGVEQVVYGR